MADEAKEAEETSEPPAPKKGSGLVMLLLAAVASLGAGAGAGLFALGPMLGPKSSAEAAGKPQGEKHAGHGGEGEKTDGAPLYTIDNLVVNPSGTQGTRFLVVSLAIRVSDKTTTEQLVAHDPEIRDALLGLLASRTVQQLSNPGIRDSLKVQLRAAVETVMGKGTVANILMPQFVLQ